MSYKNTTSSEKWNLHKTKLSKPRMSHSMTAINDKQMIIIGGDYGDYNRYSNTIDLFDISREEKEKNKLQVCNIVTERTSHSAVVLNNYLYLVGGFNNVSVYRMDLSKYNDSSTNTSPSNHSYIWETDLIPDIDRVRSDATAIAYDENIYLFGGVDVARCEVLSTCLRYKPYSSSNLPPIEKSWEKVASMKTERCCHTTVKVLDKIYIIGGCDRSKIPLNSMEIFDPFENKFEDGPPLPIPLASFAAVSIANKYIVVVGGYKAKLCRTCINEEIFVFDIHKKEWKTIRSPSMNTPRIVHAAAVLQKDKIFVCGGFRNNNPLDTIE